MSRFLPHLSLSVLAMSIGLSACGGEKAVIAQNDENQDSDQIIEVVVDTKPVPAETSIECSANNLPMSDRFPDHILIDGVNSEKLYLRKDWLGWYFFPIQLGSLDDKDAGCVLEDSAGEGVPQKIVCTYSQFPWGSRTLTIPLEASFVRTQYLDGQLTKGFWKIGNAQLEGRNVYKSEDSLDLECTPRSPDFDRNPITIDEVTKIQPWDQDEEYTKIRYGNPNE